VKYVGGEIGDKNTPDLAGRGGGVCTRPVPDYPINGGI